MLHRMTMNSLTSTPHSCISIVGTVALVEVVTVQKRELTPTTVNIVQQDGSTSPTKVCPRECQSSCSVKYIILYQKMTLFFTPYPHHLLSIPAVCKPLEHPMVPRNHHTQCPTLLLNKPPLYPQIHSFPLQAEDCPQYCNAL